MARPEYASEHLQSIADGIRAVTSGFDDAYWSACDEEHRFPKDVWDKIVELGLPGIPFSEEYGGADGGTLAYIIAVEEIAKVCGSTALGYAAHVSLGTYPIYRWGGDKLCSLYVPKLVAGEYMGAYGLTEPNAGSDSGGTQTPRPRRWRLDPQRRKCFVTNANHAGASSAPPSPTNNEQGHQRIRGAGEHPASPSRRGRSSACAAPTGRAWSSRTLASRVITCSAPRAKASRPS